MSFYVHILISLIVPVKLFIDLLVLYMSVFAFHIKPNQQSLFVFQTFNKLGYELRKQEGNLFYKSLTRYKHSP